MTRSSWIVEVRRRLRTPPPAALETEGPRRAALVPLFVDGGELWLLLEGASGEELVPGTATLPATALSSGGDTWQAAERGAPRLGVEPAALLRLGTLDHVPEPSGDVVVPCVATVPPPADAAPAPGGPPLQRLPLTAARTPSLLEERRTLVRGVETWVTVAHFGPVKLAGAEVEIVELLLERLYQG